MKYCATLTGDTPGLARFREEHPDETIWERFREDRTSYVELADALTARQRGICAFCEAKLFTDIPTPVRQVEHWLPKSNDGNPTPEISFGFSNLHASCLGGTKPHLKPPFGVLGLPKGDNVSCGQKKDDISPESFALGERPYRPTELPLSPPIFNVRFDGELDVNPDAVSAGLSSERIAATIEYLGLNCERLKIARAAVRQYLDKELAKYEAEDTDPDPDHAVRNAMTLLATHLSPKAGETMVSFISVLRDYFGPALDGSLLPDPGWAAA